MDWRPFYDQNDPDLAWEIMLYNIFSILNTYYPEEEHNQVPTCAIWLNSDIYSFILKRDQAFEHAKASKCPKDWESAKELCNKVVHLCIMQKNEFTYSNIEENRHNPKQFWNNIQKVPGDSIHSSGKNDQYTLIDPLTGQNSNPTDTPDIFNNSSVMWLQESSLVFNLLPV